MKVDANRLNKRIGYQGKYFRLRFNPIRFYLFKFRCTELVVQSEIGRVKTHNSSIYNQLQYELSQRVLTSSRSTVDSVDFIYFVCLTRMFTFFKYAVLLKS